MSVPSTWAARTVHVERQRVRPGGPSTTTRSTHFTVLSGPQASDYIVRADGPLDLESAAVFQEALLDALVGWPNRVIVDMTWVTHIDHSCIDVLMSTQRRGEAASTRMVLQAPSPVVEQELDQAGYRDLLPIRRLPQA